MRIVVQRVREAAVRVDGEVIGQIGQGLVLLVAIGQNDTEEEMRFWSEKCAHLRIFEDDQHKMNRSILDTHGEMLVISQFTLYGDVRKGRRPSFAAAARPAVAETLFRTFVTLLRDHGVRISEGRFGAMMEVEIHNAGPVTMILER